MGFDLETKNKNGYTLLLQTASSYHTTEGFKKLIEFGASPIPRDCKGRSILHILLTAFGSHCQLDEIRYFVEQEVDPLTTDDAGNNLWHTIANLGARYNNREQLSVMRLLMEYRVPPMARNYAGQTPLHVAFSVGWRSNKHNSLEFLLKEVGADINVADYDRYDLII